MKKRMKKTKIVCTIGPASESPEVLKKLVNAGMNVMRLNFSHGDYEEHGRKIQTLKNVNKELKRNCAILLDTKGPEIRTGDFVGDKATFTRGQVSTLCIEDMVGTSERFSITYKELYKDVKPGGFVLIDDGKIKLLIDHVEGTDIVCVCANDGVVGNKRGINVPGIELGFEYISEKDRADLEFGCENNVDFIAASFVRRPQDVLDVKRVLVENGKPDIQIIAKIENQEGVEKMDEIIKVADGIMVARGDLGVEVPAEDVPLIQKELIKKCKAVGKVVITATQMLESMQENPRPTRAEVSDVANAIYDGTDAIMLSGESAQGKYPEEAVRTMAQIARKTESTLDYASLYRKAVRTAAHDTSEAICMSVAEIATKFNVAAIIAFTESGFTARKMSRYRPECPIIAATPRAETIRKLALHWGIRASKCNHMDSTEGLISLAEVIAKENGVESGDMILVTGGTPGVAGKTNYLQLITVN